MARGTAEKLVVHRLGWLHRACSVFVLDAGGRLLLQRRAAGKYHSGGLWSNTCCGHPAPGEAPLASARRRLIEEMGVDCRLQPRGAFVYAADVGCGLTEYEYDHLFVGRFDGDPSPNDDEVSEWRWTTLAAVRDDLARHPDRYTAWLPLALQRLHRYFPKEEYEHTR